MNLEQVKVDPSSAENQNSHSIAEIQNCFPSKRKDVSSVITYIYKWPTYLQNTRILTKRFAGET